MNDYHLLFENQKLNKAFSSGNTLRRGVIKQLKKKMKKNNIVHKILKGNGINITSSPFKNIDHSFSHRIKDNNFETSRENKVTNVD
mmetsp:Transcript_7483/g.6630  ORF Transcript_7483/g.6630 Transcript_7483/m.6630 type:complete len:86 (+) Transcript_7483:593-850(+)